MGVIELVILAEISDFAAENVRLRAENRGVLGACPFLGEKGG